MILSNPRYKFWKVFWTVLAIHISFTAFGIVSTLMFNEKAEIVKTFLRPEQLIKQGISIVIYIFFYYIILNQFNRLIVARAGFLKYFLTCIIGFTALLTFHALLQYMFPDTSMEHLRLAAVIYTRSIFGLFALGLGLLIAYLNNLRDEKMQRKILEEQKMQLEVEKSQANLNFLKAQINPHFLHNTLNYLYAKSLPLSDELSEGILTLSDIMRYALGDGNSVDGKALLNEEVEHVKNVIKINQLRFSNKLNVDLQINGRFNGARIIPFVLITLVENAFKHGDLKSAEDPIIIKLDVADNVLNFYCRNKKKTGPKELSTGLGLDNIRKRLDLAYGSNHSFIVKDEVEYYTTELTLKSL